MFFHVSMKRVFQPCLQKLARFSTTSLILYFFLAKLRKRADFPTKDIQNRNKSFKNL